MAKPFMAKSMSAEKIKEHCVGADSLNQHREVKMEIPVENDQFYVFRRMGSVWGRMLNIRIWKCKLTATSVERGCT
jgi:hypothetical protein